MHIKINYKNAYLYLFLQYYNYTIETLVIFPHIIITIRIALTM